MPQSRPPAEYAIPIPKPRRSLRARGNFTPGFVGGVLRLALFTSALLITVVGAAWYKHWIPWKSAATKASASVISGPTNVGSDPPVTTAGRTLPTAPPFNVSKPEAVAAPESSAKSSNSKRSAVKPAVAKTAPVSTFAVKNSKILPDASAASNSAARSVAEGVYVPPKLIHSVRALASIEAVRDFETGNVVIDAVVGTSGEVHFVSVLSGPPSLRAPAIESLKEYRYEPATRNGQPVPAHVTITIHFRFEP